MKRTLSLLIIGAIACALCLSSCAEERPPINRVQPLALKKSYFVGPDLQDPKDNPEFWTQGTLIDVGFGAAQDGLFTSTYAQPMSRLRWQVTEDHLLGRLAHERVQGSDGKGGNAAVSDGVIVVAFEIESHFDIVNAYNPTTGEQLNILEENDSDRPWYEREYMRVDWSKNLNVDSYDFDTLSLLGIYGGIEYEALAYDVTSPNDLEAAVFDLDNGYFDVTTKAFAKPLTVDLSMFDWGIAALPACFLDADFFSGSFPAGTCSPVELTIRHSFRKVEDTDYEPLDWDGFRFQAYGAFTVERLGYARNYGMSDDLWRRFIARYQIWQRSHHYEDPETMTGPTECFTPGTTPFGADPHRDEDADGTEDECAAIGGGSRCDVYRQRCTLPYADRTTRTIAWYFTEGGDPEFFEPTAQATHDWDVAMRAAARTAQYAECMRLPDADGAKCAERFPIYFGQQDDNVDAVALAAEVDDCRRGRAYEGEDCDALAERLADERGYTAGVVAVAKMDEMIVLCHSPVEADDHEACGTKRLPEGVTGADCVASEGAERPAACDQALRVRRGDLRYHQVNVISEPQTPSPWGIYTDAEDPLTGETVSASINVWANVNYRWSQGVIDVIRYIEGELDLSEVTEGTNVKNWALAAEAATSGGGVLPRLSREELTHRLAGFAGATESQAHAAAEGTSGLAPEVREKARMLARELRGVSASLKAAPTTRAVYAARRNAALGSEVEAELMTRMMQELSGVDGLPLSDTVMNAASPLRGANPSVQRDLYHLRESALAHRGSCVLQEAEAPLAISELADVLQEKFGGFNPEDSESVQQNRAERMRRFVARKAHYSVIVHEMGHSIGMRHNFVSSSDAWGYRPQYWQLRTRNGTVDKVCDDLAADGAECVGPRYFDPTTQEERDNLIWMFSHSSVMDYAGEITQDMLGLGVFDFAAARMFYGDAVAVHADESYEVGTPRGEGMISKMDNFGGILGIQPRLGSADIHYSRLQKEFELIRDCASVDADTFKPARWDKAVNGKWHPTFDGLIVKVDGEHSRCRQQPVDYVNWDTMRMPTDEESGGYYRGGVSIDPKGRVRLPYGFGTDGWADLGNLSVYRHDNGADAYEIFDFLITQQEVGHIFDNYRRGRQSFSVRRAANRTLHRYNTKLRDGAKGLGLIKNIYQTFSLEIGYDFDELWPEIAPDFFPDNILAAGMVFDHFTRMLARPEVGEHFRPGFDPVLRSARDTVSEPGATLVVVPNGATGFYKNIGIGGKLVENQLAEDKGEYDSWYTINAGSYYDKINTAMLMTESVDNFISSSRTDFVDPRYRAVSLADLFPDGYRRWLGNNLTGDDSLKGARLVANGSKQPIVDSEGYPKSPIGWISWWTPVPETCFPGDGTTVCSSYGSPTSEPFKPDAPENVTVLDPQVGWEQQKFLIAWTLVYLPENQKQNWLDMLSMWEIGHDADPGFENRLELHYPAGQIYVAKTYGMEPIFGKQVQRGIAARVLGYANGLMAKAYMTTDGPDLNGDGEPDWYLPVFNEDTGEPIVKWDSELTHISPSGDDLPFGKQGCNSADSKRCTCASNRFCMQLQDYMSVVAYLRDAMVAFHPGEAEPRGIYGKP